LTTEEQRERFHLARKRGGRCGACGRPLDPDEAVYIERFEVGPLIGRRVSATAPVGAECASRGFLEEMEGQNPERCAGCGRGVYYRTASSRRRQALCSRDCGTRAQAAKRQQGA
jgi:hypothetical protein